MGVKFQIVGSSDVYGRIRCNVIDQNFNGSTTALNGSTRDFCTLELIRPSQDLSSVIHEGRLTVQFYSEVEGLTRELGEFESRTYQVEVLDDLDAIIWKGWIDPEQYAENYHSTPYLCQFTATDQLETLKNKKITLSNTSRSLWAYILDALNETGLDLPIIESINIYDALMNSDPSDSPLLQAHVIGSTFLNGDTTASAYDIIDKILKPFIGRIYQYRGWRIEEVRRTGSFIQRTYTSAGVFQSSASVDPVKTINKNNLTLRAIAQKSATLNYAPALNNAEVYINTVELTGETTTGGFQNALDWVSETELVSWNVVSGVQGITIQRVEVNTKFPFAVEIPDFQDALEPNYIESDPYDVLASDNAGISVSFQYRANFPSLMVLGTKPTLYFQIRLETTINSLPITVYWDGLNWLYNEFFIPIQINDRLKWKQYSTITDPPLSDGQIKFRIYKMVRSGSGMNWLRLTDWNTNLKVVQPSNDIILLEGATTNIETDYKGPSFQHYISDGLVLGRSGVMEVGGALTGTWSRRGKSDGLNIRRLFLLQWLSLNGRPTALFQSSFYTKNESLTPMDILRDDPTINDDLYCTIGFKLSLGSGRADIRYREVLSIDVNPTYFEEELDKIRDGDYIIYPPNITAPGLSPGVNLPSGGNQLPNITFPPLSGDVTGNPSNARLTKDSITSKERLDFTGLDPSEIIFNAVKNTIDGQAVTILSLADVKTIIGSDGNPLTIGSPANGLAINNDVLTLALASSGTTGALSSADWNTFNNKQPAGNYVPYIGATANLDMGNFKVTSTGLEVNTDPAVFKGDTIIDSSLFLTAFAPATGRNLISIGQNGGQAYAITDNSANWNTAFGWGNHATQGYQTAGDVATIIVSDVDKGFVDALNVDAATLDGQNGTYYLAWNNLTGVPSTFTPSAHTHDAGDVNSGIFSIARIPNLSASKITSGTFADARIASATNWNAAYNYSQVGHIPNSQKGNANGVATLDGNGKVPLTQINDSIIGQVEYKGLWNASTNTPTLPTTPTEKGHYYIVSNAGTQFGESYEVGDWIISDGSSWSKVDNTDAVSSVFGRTGNVSGIESDYQSFYPRLSQSYTNPTWISSLDWGKITGKPSTFTPSAHTHPWSQITSTPTTLVGYGITDAVTSSRTITINGVTQNLSANRTWTIPTHDAVTLGTPNGLSLSGQQLSLGLASASTTGALSSADWTAFDAKIGGSIASGQVAFGTGAGTIGGNNGLVWDNATRFLKIGTGLGSSQLQAVLNQDRSLDITASLASPIYLTATQNPISQNLRELGFKASLLAFETGATTGAVATLRWSILSNGILQSNGAQTIQTSTGDLTLATGNGNGNIVLTPHGTGTVRVTNIPNLGSTPTEVLVPSATGVVSKRTLAEFKSDLGLAGDYWTKTELVAPLDQSKGGLYLNSASDDLNTLIGGDNGIATNLAQNTPPWTSASGYHWYQTFNEYSSNTNDLLQLAWAFRGAGSLGFRNKNNAGVWTSWVQVLDSTNYASVLGSVYQPVGSYVPTSRAITINGVTQNLSANRTWTIPTHDAVTLGTANGLSLVGQQLSLGLASASTTGALSSADWSTFDAKIEGTIDGGQVAFGIGNGVIYGDDSFVWDNGNKILDVNGTTRIRSINNLGTTPTEVLVPSATGVVSKRTLTEFKSDLGVVQSINAGTGIAVYPNPTNATPQVALAGQALSFHSVTGDGFVYRTSGIVGTRELTAGAGITITNGDGIAGNPVISASNTVKAEYNSSLVSLTGTMQVISTGISIAIGDIGPGDYIEYSAIIDLRLSSIAANESIGLRPKTSVASSLGAATLNVPTSGQYGIIEMKAFFYVTGVGQLKGLATFEYLRQDSTFSGTFKQSTTYSTIQTSGGMDSINFDFQIEAFRHLTSNIDTQVYFETVKIYKG